jgi:hypothetical protein
MLMFAMAFAMQYGIGLILDLWPAVNGVYPAQAYQTAFAIMLGLDVLSVIWLFTPRRSS